MPGGMPEEAGHAAAAKPCPVCLGVLQSLDEACRACEAPAELVAAVRRSDGNCADWVAVPSCSAAAIAAAVR